MARSLAILMLLALTARAAADVRADYLLHCGGCHLAQGQGAPPRVPTLRDELGWLLATQEGRDYLVRVPGASQAPVSDAQLTSIMNWVLRSFNPATLPDGFEGLSDAEVASARRRVLADPARERKRLWDLYRNDG